MKESSFAQQCLDILKQEDVKKEIRLLSRPVIDFILYEINPFIYFIIIILILIFVMNLAILLFIFFNHRIYSQTRIISLL
jgi:hypothetical protein